MAIAVPTTATEGVPMDAMRKTSLVAGGFYLTSLLSVVTLLPGVNAPPVRAA